jgi:2'-5' RNA ligase
MGFSDNRQLLLDLGLPPLPALRDGGRSRVAGDRVFFAAVPPPDVAEAIAHGAMQLLAGQGIRIEWRPARVLHVSLAGVGIWEALQAEALPHARRIGANIDAEAFPVRFAQALTFGKARRRALVLVPEQSSIRPIAALARSLHRELAAGRHGPLRESFAPHLTVGYAAGDVDAVPASSVTGWTVRDIVLVRSRYGEARHEELGRWALADPPQYAQEERRTARGR